MVGFRRVHLGGWVIHPLTIHALKAMRERGIELTWVDRVVNQPQRTEVRVDGTFHCLGEVAEREFRVLRVVLASNRADALVITVFFDRRMRGRLE